MGKHNDPIQALIESGNTGHIHTILVDGKILVQGGKVLGLDETDFMGRVQKECKSAWEAIPNWHFAGLRADRLRPPAYPTLCPQNFFRKPSASSSWNRERSTKSVGL